MQQHNLHASWKRRKWYFISEKSNSPKFDDKVWHAITNIASIPTKSIINSAMDRLLYFFFPHSEVLELRILGANPGFG